METNKNFDLSKFKKVQDEMIVKNNSSWDSIYDLSKRNVGNLKDYTLEEVDKIINSSDASSQQKLSRNYYYKDGFYKRIIFHYATILKYIGLLVPNTGAGASLSNSHINKRYISAMDYVENLNLPELLTNCSLRALIDGSYYGIIIKLSKNDFVLFDLPTGYCRSGYKDVRGNDVLEFDVNYFNSIILDSDKKSVLNVYPKIISGYYKRYMNGKEPTNWVKIPSESGGVCFTFFDGRPLFLNIIPSTIQYDQAVETERERDLEEIRKIIIQKIPHLTSDGTLVFEPDEALEMHRGAVDMMGKNSNVSVLTTYADVDSIVSHTSADTASNNLEKMMQNIYYEASASSQVFSPTNSQSVKTSLQNDAALMMILANKYSSFITNILNNLFSNSNINFKYMILPITYYNTSDYITDSFKLAQSGYSWIIPSLALGLSQRDLVNVKDLENDFLKLGDKLRPLSSAYTQSVGAAEAETKTPGGVTKELEEKSPKTIKNNDSESKGGS